MKECWINVYQSTYDGLPYMGNMKHDNRKDADFWAFPSWVKGFVTIKCIYRIHVRMK